MEVVLCERSKVARQYAFLSLKYSWVWQGQVSVAWHFCSASSIHSSARRFASSPSYALLRHGFNIGNPECSATELLRGHKSLITKRRLASCSIAMLKSNLLTASPKVINYYPVGIALIMILGALQRFASDMRQVFSILAGSAVYTNSDNNGCDQLDAS
uniref:Uncharacterized protein n=1 Tax=Setaria digitata TaxID=48799 RepID=A0A915Q7G9_9BILA